MRVRLIWLLAIISAPLLVGAGWLHYHTVQFDDLIEKAATRHALDFYLVKALIFEESWFRPDIRGAAGEVGLMQITSAAAREFSDKEGIPPFNEARLTEPSLNIEIGCWYLRQSLDRYGDTLHPTLFALLRYNAGEVRADHWMKLALARPVPAGTSPETYILSFVDYPRTRGYVKRILRRSRSRNFWL